MTSKGESGGYFHFIPCCQLSGCWREGWGCGLQGQQALGCGGSPFLIKVFIFSFGARKMLLYTGTWVPSCATAS